MAEETTVVETEDTIEPSKMTEEQLDLALAETQKEDAQPTEVTQPAKEAEEKVATTETSLTQEAEQQEKDNAAAEAAIGNAKWDTITDPAELKKILAAKEEALSKKDKVLSDKELFNQRLANELGELRKVVSTPPPPPRELPPLDPDAIAQLDPVTAVEVVLARREQERLLEVDRINYVKRQNKAFVVEKIPDFEARIEDIAAVAKEDGISDAAIANFKKDPWAESPFMLINLASRAKHIKELKNLKAEIETLKKKPEEVLKKISEAAKNKTMTSSSGQGGSSKLPISIEQIHTMSDAELDAAYKEAK